MSKQRKMVLRITGAAILPVLWAAGIGSAAAAAPAPRTFNSTVTHTGPAGNTVTRQSSLTTNGQGGYTSKSTWTGPKGNTVTTSGQGQYNAAAGTFNQSRTTTYPNGKTSSESRSVSVAPAAAQPPGN